MAINVSQFSRLRLADVRTLDGIEFWDFVDLPPYQKRNGDLQYTINSGDRIDLISYQHYGTPDAWWVIAWANDLELIPSQMKEGASLIIPDPDYVLNRLFTQRAR